MSSLVVIGGSDAGIMAALRAKEKDPQLKVCMLVADAFPNFSICGLPFYLSGEVSDWRHLAHRSLAEIQASGIDVHLNTKAVKIDADRHRVIGQQENAMEKEWVYDRLVIATGSESVRPGIVGLDLPHVFTLHTMEDSFRVKEFMDTYHPSRALIIGAGYIGLEMAESLRHHGMDVSMVEQLPAILPTIDANLAHKLRAYLEVKNVNIHTGVRVQAIERTAAGLLVHGDKNFQRTVDMVLAVVGVRPVSELAVNAGIALGKGKAIAVDRFMATNHEDIFAAGDCAETYHRLLDTATYLPLGTTAHKQGRIAGENAAGGHMKFEGSLGTQVVKVFDWVVARTGIREEEAKANGYDPFSIEITGWDHKVYYPGAKEITIRITGDKKTGQLLGASLLGHLDGAVAKRVDVLAMALYNRMTVENLLHVDLSYTPPLGSPWDVIQMAADEWLKGASLRLDHS